MRGRHGHLRSKLKDLGQVEDAGLRPAEILVLLGALDSPGSDADNLLAFLDGLGGALRPAAGTADAESLAGRLLHLLRREHGFRDDEGDDDDLSNANLARVIESRRGVAGMLALVALDMVRSAGLAAEMLAFPLHTLLRLQDGGGRRIILDPSCGGRVVGAADLRALLKAGSGNAAKLEPCHYAPLGNRDMVVRLRNEVKLRLLRLGHMDRALALVEDTLLVAPGAAPLWREAGLMHLRLDRPREAVAALEQFVARSADGLARARAQALMADIRGRIH